MHCSRNNNVDRNAKFRLSPEAELLLTLDYDFELLEGDLIGCRIPDCLFTSNSVVKHAKHYKACLARAKKLGIVKDESEDDDIIFTKFVSAQRVREKPANVLETIENREVDHFPSFVDSPMVVQQQENTVMRVKRKAVHPQDLVNKYGAISGTFMEISPSQSLIPYLGKHGVESDESRQVNLKSKKQHETPRIECQSVEHKNSRGRPKKNNEDDLSYAVTPVHRRQKNENVYMDASIYHAISKGLGDDEKFHSSGLIVRRSARQMCRPVEHSTSDYFCGRKNDKLNTPQLISGPIMKMASPTKLIDLTQDEEMEDNSRMFSVVPAEIFYSISTPARPNKKQCKSIYERYVEVFGPTSSSNGQADSIKKQ